MRIETSENHKKRLKAIAVIGPLIAGLLAWFFVVVLMRMLAPGPPSMLDMVLAPPLGILVAGFIKWSIGTWKFLLSGDRPYLEIVDGVVHVRTEFSCHFAFPAEEVEFDQSWGRLSVVPRRGGAVRLPHKAFKLSNQQILEELKSQGYKVRK